MQIKDIIDYLETLAPRSLQESYDNAGLIIGDKNIECTGVLCCLDSIEAIVDEAINKGCNMIVAHHPIIFKGLKQINGKNYIERTIIKAIKHDIAIYAIHTNLDNVMHGVNGKISDMLGLENTRILQAGKDGLIKLHTYVPSDKKTAVMDALFGAGAGTIGEYDECSFTYEGQGSFRAGDGAQPYVGNKNERHYEDEHKIEVILTERIRSKVISALINAHPYEEVAYDLIPLANEDNSTGAGMIGELKTSMSSKSFLEFLKRTMQTECIRHTDLIKDEIKRVALCGGSGSFLLSAAKANGADVYITGDFKYHEFFDADNQLIICDIGHFESEQFTIQLLGDKLTENFPKFAVHFAETKTNPVNYF